MTDNTPRPTLASNRTKRNLAAVSYADMEITEEDERKRDTSLVWEGVVCLHLERH